MKKLKFKNMTCEEFSNEFDLLYNNIMSNQAPGLDEYEKSVFLTRAQDDIVKRYFTAKGNKDVEGFDSSIKRNMDFSSLYRNHITYAENIVLQKLDKETVKTNFFNRVRDIGLKVTNIAEVLKNLQQGKSSWCISTFLERTSCNFALCNDDLEDISDISDVIIKNKKYISTFTISYSKDNITNWSTICENNKDTILSFIEALFNSSSKVLEIKNTVGNNIKDIINISLSFSQKDDPVFLPINDQLLVEDTTLKKDRLLQILPITSVEYIRLMSKPFKQPLKNQAWKLQEQSTDVSLSYKLFFGKNNIFKEYTLRYLTHPFPIILTNLGDTGLSINGYVGANEKNQLVKENATTGFTCQLNPELHYEILQRAVELAKAAYGGDLLSTVQIGSVSSTNLGQVSSAPQQNNNGYSRQ